MPPPQLKEPDIDDGHVKVDWQLLCEVHSKRSNIDDDDDDDDGLGSCH